MTELVHHLFVDLETAGGIHDHHAIAGSFCLLNPRLCDLHHVLGGAISINGNAELLAERFELIDRGGSVDVGGNESGRASFAKELLCELAGGSRFS